MDAPGTQDWDPRSLGPGAARAVARAEEEARRLGHPRLGTEHLLLGLLTNDDATAQRLHDAGVTLVGARAKVGEAVGAGSEPVPSGALPCTPRASRALGRSRRFAHADGAAAVGSGHVLTAVLDVEGTAGQVLRGLGVDVEALRAPGHELVPGAPAVVPATEVRCAACGTGLGDALTYRSAVARGDGGGTRRVRVYSCGTCGGFLGLTPA
jgi:hypothetical protein